MDDTAELPRGGHHEKSELPGSRTNAGGGAPKSELPGSVGYTEVHNPEAQAHEHNPHEMQKSNPMTSETTAQVASRSTHEEAPVMKSRIDGRAELSWDYYTPELEGSNVPELESNARR